jgi:hypothetical protein
MKFCGRDMVGPAGVRGRLAAVVTFGLAVTAAACSGSAGSMTSPSGVSPVSLDHATAGAHKHFTAVVSPASLSAGQSAVLTVTVTNCDAATAGCTAGGSSTNQAIGRAEIVIPAGFTVTAVGNFSGSRLWGTTWVSGQTIEVGAQAPSAGQKKLAPGESVTFEVTVTAPSICDTYPVQALRASNATLVDTPTYDWDFYGALSLSVANCVVDCPAAPAISNAYLDSISFTGGRGDINRLVAEHMTQGAWFDGIAPCEAGYADAVIAFVSALVP